MTDAHPYEGHEPYVVHLPRSVRLTRKQFVEVCQLNRDARIELSSEGDLLIMPPTGAITGIRNMELSRQLSEWAIREGSGFAFDSATGFELPNRATRSPDASWVARQRLKGLSRQQWERFLPICPDFVVEIRSTSDLISVLQDKMQEYIANGARLGWLIDPSTRRLYVYRPGAEPECLENPASISAEPELGGFVLQLESIWQPANLPV